jgi:hypothetical protein
MSKAEIISCLALFYFIWFNRGCVTPVPPSFKAASVVGGVTSSFMAMSDFVRFRSFAFEKKEGKPIRSTIAIRSLSLSLSRHRKETYCGRREEASGTQGAT